MILNYVDCVNGEFFRNSNGEIITHTFENLPFRIQRIKLSSSSKVSNEILEAARNRLKNIHFNPSNSSGVIREKNEIRFKSYCGLIVEQLCFSMLNYYNKNKNVVIQLDDNNTSVDQIDLKIFKTWSNKNHELQTEVKTIEIRSSFPFKSIEKVVANDFDILGGYKNNIKKGELEKDFYLRFLFSLEYPEEFFVRNGNHIDYSRTTTNTLQNFYFDDELNLKRDIFIYFIGGATKEMMKDCTISYNGAMNSINFNKDKTAQYRKIKVRNSLDCVAIMQMMLNVITNELLIEK